MNRIVNAALLSALILTGCVVATGDRDHDVVVAPALPMIVEFDVEPIYFYRGFYYHYNEHDHIWRYSRYERGPWNNLPRDRYPKEVRYKHRDDRGGDHHRERDHDRDHDRDNDRYRDSD